MWTPDDRALVGDYGSGQGLTDGQCRLMLSSAPAFWFSRTARAVITVIYYASARKCLKNRGGSCRVPGWWLLGLGGVADGSLIW